MFLAVLGLSGEQFEAARHVQRARQELAPPEWCPHHQIIPVRNTPYKPPPRSRCANALLWGFALCESPSSCTQRRALAVRLHVLQRGLCRANLCATSTVLKVEELSWLFSYTTSFVDDSDFGTQARRSGSVSDVTNEHVLRIVGTATLFAVCRSSNGGILGSLAVTNSCSGIHIAPTWMHPTFCIHIMASRA